MSRREHVYFLIHKPFGYLSQFSSEAGNPGLGELFDLQKDVYPVGRLDMDSEGLLILTNDSSLNKSLLDPRNQHRRTYWVEVEGLPDEIALRELEKGVEINLKGKKYKTMHAQVTLISPEISEREPAVNRKKHPVTGWLEISLVEGKNRQVRRMTAKVGHPTLRLIRVGIEDVKLGEIPIGGIVQISGKILKKKLKL